MTSSSQQAEIERLREALEAIADESPLYHENSSGRYDPCPGCQAVIEMAKEALVAAPAPPQAALLALASHVAEVVECRPPLTGKAVEVWAARLARDVTHPDALGGG